MSVNDMSVSKKLTLAFAVVVTVVLTMCAALFVCLGQATQASKLNDDSYDAVDRLDQMKTQIWKASWAFNKYALTGDEQYIAQTETAKDNFHKLADEEHTLDHGDAGMERTVGVVKTAGDDYFTNRIEANVESLRNPATHDAALASVKSTQGGQKLRDFEGAVDDALKYANAWSDKFTEEDTAAVSNSHTALLIGGALSALLSGLMGWLLARVIARPVSQMTVAMNDLAGGNNAIEIPAIGRKD